MKRAIIYARVSTTDQVETGYSLETQIAEARLACARQGFVVVREECKRAGAELFFVTHGEVEHSPDSQILQNMEAAFNEYWREKIVEAVRRGRRGKAMRGNVVINDIPPFGYRLSKDSSNGAGRTKTICGIVLPLTSGERNLKQ
jgi:DNA invertase Pin-like site-specific DNA recombinase